MLTLTYSLFHDLLFFAVGLVSRMLIFVKGTVSIHTIRAFILHYIGVLITFPGLHMMNSSYFSRINPTSLQFMIILMFKKTKTKTDEGITSNETLPQSQRNSQKNEKTIYGVREAACQLDSKAEQKGKLI